eukprot:COSAG02_NODE_1207_length_13885_cov_124.791237_10_plen_92_part_00
MHLPPSVIFAINGLAGSIEGEEEVPALLMIGQLATQPCVTPNVGSLRSPAGSHIDTPAHTHVHTSIISATPSGYALIEQNQHECEKCVDLD